MSNEQSTNGIIVLSRYHGKLHFPEATQATALTNGEIRVTKDNELIAVLVPSDALGFYKAGTLYEKRVEEDAKEPGTSSSQFGIKGVVQTGGPTGTDGVVFGKTAAE